MRGEPTSREPSEGLRVNHPGLSRRSPLVNLTQRQFGRARFGAICPRAGGGALRQQSRGALSGLFLVTELAGIVCRARARCVLAPQLRAALRWAWFSWGRIVPLRSI